MFESNGVCICASLYMARREGVESTLALFAAIDGVESGEQQELME
jgi:hypothetical protein